MTITGNSTNNKQQIAVLTTAKSSHLEVEDISLWVGLGTKKNKGRHE